MHISPRLHQPPLSHFPHLILLLVLLPIPTLPRPIPWNDPPPNAAINTSPIKITQGEWEHNKEFKNVSTTNLAEHMFARGRQLEIAIDAARECVSHYEPLQNKRLCFAREPWFLDAPAGISSFSMLSYPLALAWMLWDWALAALLWVAEFWGGEFVSGERREEEDMDRCHLVSRGAEKSMMYDDDDRADDDDGNSRDGTRTGSPCSLPSSTSSSVCCRCGSGSGSGSDSQGETRVNSEQSTRGSGSGSGSGAADSESEMADIYRHRGRSRQRSRSRQSERSSSIQQQRHLRGRSSSSWSSNSLPATDLERLRESGGVG